MASRDDAIGIFDSGVGGLTVLHALLEALPQEDLVYLGDTGRYPYGTKSAETVTRYSIENVDFLIAKGIKLLVHQELDALRDQEVDVLDAVAGDRLGRLGAVRVAARVAQVHEVLLRQRLEEGVQK